MAKCLQKFGVVPVDTRDAQGGERFHPFTPGQHLTYRIPPKTPDWYANYNKDWGLKTGMDACAPDSVSFHYVKQDLMPKLHAELYDCRQ